MMPSVESSMGYQMSIQVYGVVVWFWVLQRSPAVGGGIFKMLCSQLTACDLAPIVIWVAHDHDKLFSLGDWGAS